jgi:hypothetical protein
VRDPAAVHPPEFVARVRQLSASGLSAREIAGAVCLPQRTVAHWCRGDRRSGRPRIRPPGCARCDGIPLDRPSYAYLLGSYLGDGHLSHRERTVRLSIYCDDAWPGVRSDVAAAMAAGPRRRAHGPVPPRPVPLRRLPDDELDDAPRGGEVKRYTYPRYFFSNESADVMGLCQAGLDRLGVAWRMPRSNMLSVTRREAVAALDVHVGPKS